MSMDEKLLWLPGTKGDLSASVLLRSIADRIEGRKDARILVIDWGGNDRPCYTSNTDDLENVLWVVQKFVYWLMSDPA